MPTALNTEALEKLYSKYNRREYVHPDPLEFLYEYDDPADREIVGLLASSLAFGRVVQILKSVSCVLHRMGTPSVFLARSSRESLRREFGDFKHRWVTGEELAAMLYDAKRVIERHGSLEACFESGLRHEHDTVLPALCGFVDSMRLESGGACGSLLPSPRMGSACKRLNLFLRWMVREDGVDPGGWYNVGPFRLVVPLDVHMYRICLALGMTERKQADMRTATEVTARFRKIVPEDPVRYDFALTRIGILGKRPEALLEEIGLRGAA
jgi:uncharacterized protein (TIGR02757 family)